MYDYLGLGKPQKENYGTDFLDMKSDYAGLSSFGRETARDIGHARRNVKKEIKRYRRDIKEIKKEASGLKKDFEYGGWIGNYIYRKRKEAKTKQQLKNLQIFGENLRAKRRV